MPTTDSAAPATKGDVTLLILQSEERLRGEMKTMEKGLRGEIKAMEKGLRGEMATKDDVRRSEERLSKQMMQMQELYAAGIEIVREEIVAANADRFAQHQDRIDDHDRRLIVLEGASPRL